jgi:hypothetical protein
MTAVTERPSARAGLSLFRGGRFYVWLTLLALALGAISLLYPSTPSYDPWSWLIWGREILHGQLTIAGGSSWKPLPVIFTTVFALFGSAQPNLWLIVARAGAVISVLMSVKLAVRITWGLISNGRDRGWFDELSRGTRAVAIAPVVLAGAITLVGTALMPKYPGNMMLGYSEGVMGAAFLVATERAWDGHHRQAFVIGLIPSLDRPEVWIIWGPYGLWLMWKDKGARVLVIGLALLTLALWIGPQKLGGGTVKGLVTHPRHNHSSTSAVNSSFPFWHELRTVVWPLTLARVEIASLLLIACTTFLTVQARRALGSWHDALRANPAAVAAALAGAFGFLWWILIALETQAGFAGNPRYAVIGGEFVYVSGAAAFGWACLGLARLGGGVLARFGQGGIGWRARLATATLVVLAVVAFVPGLFTRSLPSPSSIRYSLRYQARLREEVAALVQRQGGAKKIVACGSMMANNLQVTMVAWYLDVKIPWIQALPTSFETGKRGPNVVFQNGTSSTAAGKQQPSLAQIAAWEQGGSRYTVTKTDPVTLYMDCSSYSKT